MEQCACGKPVVAALVGMIEPIDGRVEQNPPERVRLVCWECMENTMRVEHQVFGRVFVIECRERPAEPPPPVITTHFPFGQLPNAEPAKDDPPPAT